MVKSGLKVRLLVLPLVAQVLLLRLPLDPAPRNRSLSIHRTASPR